MLSDNNIFIVILLIFCYLWLFLFIYTFYPISINAQTPTPHTTHPRPPTRLHNPIHPNIPPYTPPYIPLRSEIANEYNIALDYITSTLFSLNYAAIASLAILTGKTPLHLQQFCLLSNTSLIVFYLGNYAPRNLLWIMMCLIVGWG